MLTESARLCSLPARPGTGRLLLVACLAVLAAAASADLETDRRLVDSLTAGAPADGERIELDAQGAPFVALHKAGASRPRRGGVVLMHGPQTNLDSPDTVRPLRLGLARAGWDTLSLQLRSPYPGDTRADWLARRDEIAARLGAGLDWLGRQGIEPRVVIALGDSAPIALQYAADQPPRSLLAVVLVSAALYDDDPFGGLAVLTAIALPVLDIYAERDLAEVVDNAAMRRGAASAEGHKAAFRQVGVAGATAGYEGTTQTLVATVRAWLATQQAAASPP